MRMIDLSRLPPPDILEVLDAEAYLATLKTAFTAHWNTIRGDRLAIDTLALEHEPITGLLRTVAELRRFMTGHINDVVRALLAPLAQGADLDQIAAGVNLQRLVLTPASGQTPAVLEGDASLLRRYLLAFSRPAAGSPARYRLEAFTALPILHDIAVIGRAVHGRRGDVDLVVAGPEGRDLTNPELATITAAVQAEDVKPEATSVAVLRATRRLYSLSGRIVLPTGPDPDLVRAEATARVRAAGRERLQIGAEMPLERLTGAVYGPSIQRFDRLDPSTSIPADPYTIPILTAVTLATEVSA
ncbi:MAG: baseplate J/gp47 family protein [Rhabdaerophilum sp.]